jgi:hypothetical protein
MIILVHDLQTVKNRRELAVRRFNGTLTMPSQLLSRPGWTKIFWHIIEVKIRCRHHVLSQVQAFAALGAVIDCLRFANYQRSPLNLSQGIGFDTSQEILLPAPVSPRV